jgi:hypothetical protein
VGEAATWEGGAVAEAEVGRRDLASIPASQAEEAEELRKLPAEVAEADSEEEVVVATRARQP